MTTFSQIFALSGVNSVAALSLINLAKCCRLLERSKQQGRLDNTTTEPVSLLDNFSFYPNADQRYGL